MSSTPASEYAQLGLQETNELAKMLFYQAEALWPQEKDIINSYQGISPSSVLHIIDVGCGSGEAVFRLHHLFPNASIWGVDLEERNVLGAKQKLAKMDEKAQSKIHFQTADAYKLSEASFHSPSSNSPITFDLVLCRSMLHAVKEPEKIIKEFLKIVKPGGFIHMLNEDYGMMFYSGVKNAAKVDSLWRDGTCQYFISTGTNPHMGRDSFPIVKRIEAEWNPQQNKKIDDIRIDYLFADTIRVDRNILATIFETWRDGYTEEVVKHTKMTKDDVTEAFSDLIQCTRSESGYVCWQSVICTIHVK
jgi:ubiquinone/menaquinone biosynthesis C-methylase UbiE